MNDSLSTADTLLATAQRLFADRGYDGTSVRDITAAAGANLGAVTYHFGSKQALYHAVLEGALIPFRRRLAETAAREGTPLDRIEALLRVLFEHMANHPHIARLVVRQLAAGGEIPAVVRSTMQANIGLIARLVREGQSDGTIRDGDPQLMALSIGAQPLFLALVRHALRQAVSLDSDDPHTREALTESVVRFTRRGLQVEKDDTP